MKCACEHNFQVLEMLPIRGHGSFFGLNILSCFLQFQLGKGVSMTSVKALEKTKMPLQWLDFFPGLSRLVHL